MMNATQIRNLEANLEKAGLGLPEKVSEIDQLVFEDDNILLARYEAIDRRSIRSESGKKAEERHRKNLARKAFRIKKAEAGESRYWKDVEYISRTTVVEDSYFDGNGWYHAPRVADQVTTVTKPWKHHGKTKAEFRREGKNLPEERDIPIETYEETGEFITPYQYEVERDLANIDWEISLRFFHADGFQKAKRLVEINEELEILEAQKERLVTQYTARIQSLCDRIRAKEFEAELYRG